MNEQLKNVLTQSEIKFELIESNRNATSDELCEHLLQNALNNVRRYKKDCMYDFSRFVQLDRDYNENSFPPPFSFVIFYRETGTWFVTLTKQEIEDDDINLLIKCFRSDSFVYVEREVVSSDSNYIYEYYKIMR